MLGILYPVFTNATEMPVHFATFKLTRIVKDSRVTVVRVSWQSLPEKIV